MRFTLYMGAPIFYPHRFRTVPHGTGRSRWASHSVQTNTVCWTGPTALTHHRPSKRHIAALVVAGDETVRTDPTRAFPHLRNC